MPKSITHITGKDLMERWNMDGYQVLEIMKKVIPSPKDWEPNKQLIGGSQNTKVEFCRLLLEDDIPKDLDNKMASFQFALSEIEAIENKRYFRQNISSPIVDIDTPRDADKKLRPDQTAKNKCREVAEKLIEQNPTITIADAIRHKDMKKVSEKKDGDLYLDKTVRNWINDLWPEELRQPGRRKGT